MILERLGNDTVFAPFSAFMLHPMNISLFISLWFILIYRDVVWCHWFAPSYVWYRKYIGDSSRASQHDCSSFVVVGRFIQYPCNSLGLWVSILNSWRLSLCVWRDSSTWERLNRSCTQNVTHVDVHKCFSLVDSLVVHLKCATRPGRMFMYDRWSWCMRYVESTLVQGKTIGTVSFCARFTRVGGCRCYCF